jgi:precorrin-6B C5,15-methyltransferase / cobalt-precorrin-6B C5,C15-methyltransferase
MNKAITILGIGDDGCLGLSSRAIGAVTRAQVLAGGERQLAFFPQFQGQRIVLKHGLAERLDRIAELAAENNVCILASGDPLLFGIAAKVIERMGAAHVEIVPQPSAMQWAFAKVGLAWDDAALVSVHGRGLDGLLMRLRNYAKAACFTDAANSPAAVAAHFLDYNQDGWQAWVCENLGSPDERVRHFALADLARATDIAPLSMLILQRRDRGWQPPAAIPFLHEDDYAKRAPAKGLITKREARTLSLAALRLNRRSVLWDIGAGSGSVSIEAAMLAWEGRVYAIEADPQGVEICRENVRTHAADNVRIVAAGAPQTLAGLEDPDAVFIGGSGGALVEIMAVALARLRPGGRLVVNAVTLDNVAAAYAAYRRAGLTPEVTVLNVSRGEPLGEYLRYEALNPIHIFAAGKPDGRQ